MSAKAVHKICRDPGDTESSEEEVTEPSGLLEKNGRSPDSFALNETLLSQRSRHDSRLSNTPSPDWGGVGDSDSESDSWLSYQKDVGVGVKYISVSPDIHRVDVDSDSGSEKSVALSKSYCSSTTSSPLKQGESLSNIFLSPLKYRCETPNDTENEKNVQPGSDQKVIEISPRKGRGHVRNLSLSPKKEDIYSLIAEESKSFININESVPPPPLVENNIKNSIVIDQHTRVIQNQIVSDADKSEIVNNGNTELQINKNIRKIAPKKPKPILKQSSVVSETSPRLNRKFNSVSPKRKKNKTLAISLDGNLEKGDSEISQPKEDDEGVISDGGSKTSFDHERQARTPVRRNTYLKRDCRPKSEAFLVSLAKEEKSEDLYKSNVSLNSVSASVQSFRSEGNQRRVEENGVSEDNTVGVGNLEPKRSNFAFIRVSNTFLRRMALKVYFICISCRAI